MKRENWEVMYNLDWVKQSLDEKRKNFGRQLYQLTTRHRIACDSAAIEA